jgi:RNA polymerase sigma factor (sigma-70 family)
VTFEQFVAARLATLLRYATVVSCDPHLAEDIVQEVLLRVQPRWGRIAPLEQPEAYVKRMVLNEFLSWRRRRAAREVPLSHAGLDTVAAAAVDPAGGIGVRDDLVRRIAALPPKQRAVIALRYYEGLADSEIAVPFGPAETLAVALPNAGDDGMELADRIASSVVADMTAGCEVPLEFGWLPAGVTGHQLVKLEGDGMHELTIEIRIEPGGWLPPSIHVALGSWPTVRWRCDEQVTMRGRSGCSWTDPPVAGGIHLALDDGREVYLACDLSGLDDPPELDAADLVRIADSLRIGPPPDASWAGRR